jgi:integrase
MVEVYPQVEPLLLAFLLEKRMKRRFKGLYKMSGSQFWWFRYTRDGRRHAVSLRTTEESEAITRAQAILAEGLLAASAFSPHEPAPRRREIHGLTDQYLKDAQERNKKPLRVETARVRRYVLKKFISDCAISRVGDITPPKIQHWFSVLKGEGKSLDTLSAYGQRLRSFVKYLVPKYLPSTILIDFSVPEPSAIGRKNWLRKGEVTRILEAANGDPELKFALFCGFDAGLRRNEISEALVNWFDLEDGLLHVSKHQNFVPKDRDLRTIPLTKRFADFLKTYLQGRDQNKYVLAPEKTVKGKNKYRYDTNKRVRSHAVRCSVQCTFHDMRRSFASNRASIGVSIYKIARWLGDGIEVVDRSYGHLAPQDREINRGV